MSCCNSSEETSLCEESMQDESVRHKYRDEEQKKKLCTRLKKIEGQIRGIDSMVDQDRYCVDILTQVLAVQSALNSFSKELLARHIKECVVHDIKDEKEDAVDELCQLIQKMMK